jgi:hypothetical protein
MGWTIYVNHLQMRTMQLCNRTKDQLYELMLHDF